MYEPAVSTESHAAESRVQLFVELLARSGYSALVIQQKRAAVTCFASLHYSRNVRCQARSDADSHAVSVKDDIWLAVWRCAPHFQHNCAD